MVSLSKLFKIFLLIFISFNIVMACDLDEMYSPKHYKKASKEVVNFLNNNLGKDWYKLSVRDFIEKFSLSGHPIYDGTILPKNKNFYNIGYNHYMLSNGLSGIFFSDSKNYEKIPSGFIITKVLKGKYFAQDIFKAFNKKFNVNFTGCLYEKEANIGNGTICSSKGELKVKIYDRYFKITMVATGLMDSGHTNNDIHNTIIMFTINDYVEWVNEYKECKKEIDNAKKTGKNLTF